jgi:CheY-like chemotaxis protein/anti-sigma regulatory factor (Ser/Thr protein kinase)
MNSNGSQILVVEDNPISRSLLEIALARQGHRVVSAEDAAQAQAQLTPANINSFACVVTDYLMPGMNGLELLAWIRERDPGLATILVTAKGEKELIAESLRGGAIDFLDKPVDLKKLRAAVERAVAQTSRHRHMAESESAVKELGLAQQRMLDAETGRCPGILQVYYHPKHEAGGDYFTHFRPAPDQLFCLLTDVSGHDLHAAYVSAYFQGFVRGFSMHGATVEEIFRDFNHFLLEELNSGGGGGVHNGLAVEASVAACAVQLDFRTQTATIITQGTPSPVYLPREGQVQVLGENGGVPLGWFSTLALRRTVQSIADGGSFYLWTDGFEDLAGREGVNTLSLAYAWQRSKERNEPLHCLEAANDDVLLAVVHLASGDPVAKAFWPVLSEHYHGGQLEGIDALQSDWHRSLALAVPQIPPSRMHDILLACREAMLNALEHGCARRPDREAGLMMSYCVSRQIFRVRVSDGGPGHQFDIERQEQRATRELVDEHRGLLLMKSLATRLRLERNGAEVIMDFSITAKR